MSNEWHKDGGGFDSVPLHDETGSESENSNYAEATEYTESGDAPADSITASGVGTEAANDSAAQSDTTYSWVNPKLQHGGDTWSTAGGEERSGARNAWGEPEKRGAQTQSQYEAYRFSQPISGLEPKTKRKKQRSPILKKFGLCAALALVFGVIAGFTILGITSLGAGDSRPVSPTIPSTETTSSGSSVQSDQETATTTAAGDRNSTVADVAKNAMPSLVSISNKSVQEVESFFGGRQAYESESSGSGIIVGQNDAELLIATNNHVISGANTITVSFIDSSSVEAKIKGTDVNNDLAVVAVALTDLSEETLAEIKTAAIGNSDSLVVGEQVVAIGNALGYGQSVTSGYVSALDREVTVDNVTARLIQTDAAINPGNSGGALLNMQGELIGINSVKFAANEVEGMGYAIPVGTAEPILGELMNRETRSKVDKRKASYLGIGCKNVTAETSQMYNMPVGVFVDEVTAGSAAEKAGMLKGDILTKFDGTSISSYAELVSTLEYYAAGETVSIIVHRAESGEYKEVTLEVTLDERPDDAEVFGSQSQP